MPWRSRLACSILAEHLDVPFQVEYRAADVVVDGVHASLVVGADLELQLGYLGHRAGVEHEHAPEVGSGGEDALQALGFALLGGWVGDDAEDVAEEAGLQLGLLSFKNLCGWRRDGQSMCRVVDESVGDDEGLSAGMSHLDVG